MAVNRTIVLMRPADPDEDGPALASLGTRESVADALSAFNTAPDGADRSSSAGTDVFYGPGMVVEIPTTTDDICQAMVTMLDEELAFPVLMRLCKELEWRMMDPDTGRTFG